VYLSNLLSHTEHHGCIHVECIEDNVSVNHTAAFVTHDWHIRRPEIALHTSLQDQTNLMKLIRLVCYGATAERRHLFIRNQLMRLLKYSSNVLWACNPPAVDANPPAPKTRRASHAA
jgi:hypothetical protein